MNGRENKRQQERKLEEFRSFRTSKRRKKRREQRNDEEKLKLRIVLCVKNSSEKPSNQVVIEN